MKVYKWMDTDHHHVAVLRPDELFDLSTLDWPAPDDKETYVDGANLVSGERETYAMAYNKDWWPLHVWQSMYTRKPEMYAERDAQQLEQLRQIRRAS